MNTYSETLLTNRSQEKELLDLGPEHYTPEEFTHCQKMLFRVNKVFGFFNSTRRFLKKFSTTSSLLDVGCGGGLFVLHLSHYFPNMQLQGVDISEQAIHAADNELNEWKKTYPTVNVSFELKKIVNFSYSPHDILLSTMMCHHLNDEEIVLFLKNSLLAARQAVIINDLHRHRVAEFFYAFLSPLLFRNRLITHDGLISIRRGFTYSDWKKLITKAGITHYQIKWCFPFRWQIILWKK